MMNSTYGQVQITDRIDMDGEVWEVQGVEPWTVEGTLLINCVDPDGNLHGLLQASTDPVEVLAP